MMSRPGRPSEFNRDAALEVALLAFWRNGYQGTSVKSLSEELGITRSSFYNAYGSQEAIFLEALNQYLDRSPDRAMANETPEGSICALISETFRVICASLAGDPDAKGCLAVNSVSALCNVDQNLGPKVAALMVERLYRIEKLINLAVQKGELPSDTDIKATALAMKTFLVGLNCMAKVLPDRDDLWPAARIMLANLGMLPKP